MIREFLEDVSEKNQLKKALYKLIHKEESISKVELLRKFHVPNTTMTRMLGDLENKQLIRQCGFGQSIGGRRPALYEIVPSAGYLIGIEIARTHVDVTLLNLKFQSVGEIHFTLSNQHTPKVTVGLIAKGIRHLLEQHKVDSVLGIGIGAVGPIDREKGIILNPEAFPAEGWKDVPIVEILKEMFSVPVILNNGANTAAIAEYFVQSTEGESLLYCISGYGIRCGFIQDGQLQHNKQGDASSFGHIIIEADGRLCECGNRGCLTSYATFGAMFKLMEEKGIPASFDQLFHTRDPRVKDIILNSAKYYGIGIANMINILHPSTVILHGKLIYQDNDYYDELVRIARINTYTGNQEVNIRKGSLDEKAVSIGAAIQVFEHFFM